jgi:hypothetical protein
MQRRKALAAAGAITATATAAVIALGANLGLFGLTADQSGPGTFKLVDQASTPATQVVDIPVPVTSASGTTPSRSGAPSATLPQPTAPTVAPSYRSDDDEHEAEHEDEYEAEHEEEDDD